jgi:hypothetical protein
MWSNISKRVNIAIWASCYWVMSLRAYVYILVQRQYTHTFLILAVPQVSPMQASFKWCHLVISFPSGSSQCGANKVKRINPRKYAMIKRLQVISTNGNVTRTHCWRKICTLRQAHSKLNKLASQAKRFQDVPVNFSWKINKRQSS